MGGDYDERPPLGEGLAGVDESVRPRSLEEFIGQDELRANLRVYLDAARGGARLWTILCSTAIPVWARRPWPRSWPQNWA